MIQLVSVQMLRGVMVRTHSMQIADTNRTAAFMRVMRFAKGAREYQELDLPVARRVVIFANNTPKRTATIAVATGIQVSTMLADVRRFERFIAAATAAGATHVAWT